MSDVKLEYCDGEIYAMTGGTPAHADLAAAVIRLLGSALEGHCRVSSSDLKVRIEATGLSAFPDVSVACGERRFAAIDKNALVNPTLLVEVTSNSTSWWTPPSPSRSMTCTPASHSRVEAIEIVARINARLVCPEL